GWARMDDNRHIRLRLKGNAGREKAGVDSHRQAESPTRGEVLSRCRRVTYDIGSDKHVSGNLRLLRRCRDGGGDLLRLQAIDLEQIVLHTVFVRKRIRQPEPHQRGYGAMLEQ